MMHVHENLEDKKWINRCIDLARRGIGLVSPNPPVGAVLVHSGAVLGEGFHTGYGKAHAEVEAIQNVPSDKLHLIPECTLYVSLEPCCIFGKTPPCTSKIIESGIRRVVVGCLDPNPEMAGNGIKLLTENGIDVVVGIMEAECRELIHPFTVNILQKRPYIILKWAQSRDLFYSEINKRTTLSSSESLSFTHSLRAQSDAIVCGARTISIDDPLLTTRYYPGDSPTPVIIDLSQRLTGNEKIFNSANLIYFSSRKRAFESESIQSFEVVNSENQITEVLNVLFTLRLGVVLVEGGAYLQQKFIDENLWDEAWILKTKHVLKEGLPAPQVKGSLISKRETNGEEIIGILNTKDD